jgi:hypothetical protein
MPAVLVQQNCSHPKLSAWIAQLLEMAVFAYDVSQTNQAFRSVSLVLDILCFLISTIRVFCTSRWQAHISPAACACTCLCQAASLLRHFEAASFLEESNGATTNKTTEAMLRRFHDFAADLLSHDCCLPETSSWPKYHFVGYFRNSPWT